MDIGPSRYRSGRLSAELSRQLQEALGQSYVLERELGGGGMSRVFLAEEAALGRRVVVKVLPPELAEGVSAERFTREVKLAARLQHPNIVPVLTAGDAVGLPYYTMPFVRGESLRARLAQGTPLSIDETVGVVRDVARALAYAHGEGVVHRDIKPDNVLLSGGVAMVADFGIAKAISASVTTGRITSAGVALGTPGYMAPEQALADPAADHRVDLYALGVLAWEMLVGRPIFGDRAGQALVAAHISEVPANVATQRRDVPPALGALVMELLAKQPDDRPSSATQVLERLNAFASPPSRVGRRLAGAIAILIVTIAVIAGWWRVRSTAPDASMNVVAIAPFRVSGADPSLQYLREGMVDLLAAKIGGVGGLRAVDPRTTLVAWRRAAGGNDDMSSSDAMRVAAEIGAGRLVLGELAGTTANLQLSATLLPAPTGRDPIKAITSGPADSLPTLVDRLTAQLEALGAGEAAPRLTALTSTSLPALRAYLDGQALYRSARTNVAMQSYFRAVELDSSFALAALGLVRTVGWGGQSPADQARAMAVGGHILIRERRRLSPVDAALADAALGPRYPAPKTYPEWYAAAERVTSLAPESAEGWFEVGDALFHGGGILGTADSDERAFRAFSRVIALDSAYLPAFVHLSVLFAEAGDTANVRRLHAIAQRTDSTLAGGYYGMRLAVLTGDSARAQSIRAGMDRLSPTQLAIFAYGALQNHQGLDDAQRALDLLAQQAITSEQRAQLAALRLRVAIERGRTAEAAKVPAALIAAPAFAREVALAAVFADGDSAIGAAAARTLEPVSASALGAPLTLGRAADSAGVKAEVALAERADNAFVLAQYRLAMRDVALAARGIAWLRSYVPPRDSAWLGEVTGERALLLEAQSAALEGRPDAADVLARLDSAARFGHHDVRFTTVSSLVAARLWEARGDQRRAYQALQRRSRGVGANLYESTWQREVGRLAAAIGEREVAIRAYRAYLTRRANPEPALASEVAHVRAELARLERSSVGR